MKILLLGGTGAMGKHLTSILSKSKSITFVTTRKKLSSTSYVKYIEGNAHNVDFLDEVLCLESWDVIVDFMVYSTIEFNTRVKKLLNSTKQYIYISSARVFDYSENPITEESSRLLDSSVDVDFLSTDEYSLTKARQENILSNSNYKNWTIIRPYITYSEIRLQLGVYEKEDWLYRALKGKTIVFSSDLRDKLTTLTYGLDVANCIYYIINNPKALGQSYNATTKKNIYWKDVLELYLSVLTEYLGYTPNVLYLNDVEFKKCTHSEYQVIYDRFFDRKFDNSLIAEFIDTKNFISPFLGLKQCLAEFLENPKFTNINWKLEAKKDKITNEKAQLRDIKGFKNKIKYLLYRYV